ncbi:hypothetical protein SPRG_11449 [Saprolegnia parasitica CBS 223.65]|uniref:Fibronectin type-III domain-containing protein n=1 Tax=Saprolegnia parasitica (strain CBS 223.65) TaxID=695850 RepID=A0A067C964_SAPPC|nr:hypothetical protein SPRG_11449 [Saprolegnia parasitica CBS 223.65]KDO23357.1 hypothetical protein SPRG_11449 [Saprolegnia parasitica CBS 223.65]|eukprot:XP_012205848.1 hypothetical protein SPRG_11449 [Saprolegnia parasitica CBS 223.65]
MVDGPALYGGRRLAAASNDVRAIYELSTKETVSVLSYNLMRQLHATNNYKPYCAEYILGSTRRKDQLLAEITAYDADVLCLQEVDDYELYWIHALNALGYDSVYHRRPGDYDDGLVIAFRRLNFQVFRTQRVDFNDLVARTRRENLAAKLEQDNIALFVALQPWETCAFPSPLCVVNVQLASHRDHDVVRDLQLRYLLPQVEAFNADFQMPVVVAGSFNARPSDDVYHVMRTGRARPAPAPPTRLAPPVLSDATTSTLVVSWETPISVDGPVLAYRLDRRVNGSTTVGFSHEIVLDDVATSHKITMLSAGTQYEFRVAAKNAFGWSAYSPASAPFQTLQGRHHAWRGRPPVVPPAENDDLSNPFKLSYGSGKTPRFIDGTVQDQQCPRPSRLEPDDAIYETLQFRGDREDGLLHYEVFESAYGRYSYGGEPVCTYVTEAWTGTVDYIFFTKKELAPFQLLTLPSLGTLVGNDVREPPTIVDADYAAYIPRDWDSRVTLGDKRNPQYAGAWPPSVFQLPNPKRSHEWLPNETFASDHFALLVVLAFCDHELATSWN